MANMDLNNATPRHLSTGAQDNSSRALPSELKSNCQHIPLYFIFAPKGTTEGKFAKAGAQLQIWGEEAFDINSKYAQHPIRLRKFLNEKGIPSTGAYIKRLVPKDIGVNANITLYLDVLETKVPRYARTSSGADYVNPVTGQKEVVGYVDGFKVKWYKKSFSKLESYGALKVEDGTMVKWVMDLSETSTEIHVNRKDSNDIANTTSGHALWANKTVYVYETDLDLYVPKLKLTKREKYTVDANGNSKHVADEIFGNDVDTVAKSKLYPMFEVRAAYPGSWYNLAGFSIQSLVGESRPASFMEATKNNLYNLFVYTKAGETKAPTLQRNLLGEDSSNFTFLKNGLNPVTQVNVGFETVVATQLFNDGKRPDKSIIFPLFDRIYLYREHLETLLGKFNFAEVPFITHDVENMKDGQEAAASTWYDHSGMTRDELLQESGLINPFTCKTAKGINYVSLSYDLTAPADKNATLTEVNMVNNTPIFLEGGTDGTMNNEVFEELVREHMDRYLDDNDQVNDLGLAEETFLYDTGFQLETKKKLAQFISVRKDTNVMTSPFVANADKQLSISDTVSLGTQIVASSRLYPESDQYGTRTIRSTVVIGDGIAFPDGPDRDPLIFELAYKTAMLMGGDDGKWKPEYIFDSGSSNAIKHLLDPTPKFIPPRTQEQMKKSGLNYILPTNGGNEYFFPMVQTVYPDSTSIANSYINSLCIGALERKAYQVWRELTGDIKMSPDVFANYGRDLATRLVENIFGGIVTVYPEFIITEADAQRGFSWHLEYKIFGNVMKTVQVYTSKLYRTELAGSNA